MTILAAKSDCRYLAAMYYLKGKTSRFNVTNDQVMTGNGRCVFESIKTRQRLWIRQRLDRRPEENDQVDGVAVDPIQGAASCGSPFSNQFFQSR